MTHRTMLNRFSPARRSLLANGQGSSRPSDVSWFGWNGRFLVPAMQSNSVDARSGSRIAKGNRRSRRAASLNRTAHPRDHDMTRGLRTRNSCLFIEREKLVPGNEKRLDGRHSRSVVKLTPLNIKKG